MDALPAIMANSWQRGRLLKLDDCGQAENAAHSARTGVASNPYSALKLTNFLRKQT
jgi:hypothetical protein